MRVSNMWYPIVRVHWSKKRRWPLAGRGLLNLLISHTHISTFSAPGPSIKHSHLAMLLSTFSPFHTSRSILPRTMRSNSISIFILVAFYSLLSLSFASPAPDNPSTVSTRGDSVPPTQGHNPFGSSCGPDYQDCNCRDKGACCDKDGDCCSYGWCCPNGYVLCG